MKTTIPIFYGINEAYAPYLATSLNSLKQHSSRDYNYQVTIIYQDLLESTRQRLQEFSKENITINFKKLENDLQNELSNDQNRLRADYVTFTIYYRLFIADLFPEYDKGIYLDSDTVINCDIAKLYNQDLGDNLIGAVPDSFVTHEKLGRQYASEALDVDKNFYINSGVLLMNLKELRAQDFSQKFTRLLNKYHFELAATDQDYLNAMCYGKILYLDPRWNIQPEYIISMSFIPNIVHFNLFGKPWNYDNIPFENLFWDSCRKTSFYDQVLVIKEGYSEDKKAHDRERKQSLIQQLIEIPKQDVTFKKVAEQGEKIRI